MLVNYAQHEPPTECRFHGCTRPAGETVITTWPRTHTLDGTVLVTLTGWIEERCHACARALILWPPHPLEPT